MELVCTLSPHAHSHTYTAARRRRRRLNARTLQHAVLVGSSLAGVWSVCAHVALTAYVCSFPSRLLLIESWRPLLLAIAASEDDRMVVAAWRFFSPMRPIIIGLFMGSSISSLFDNSGQIHFVFFLLKLGGNY